MTNANETISAALLTHVASGKTVPEAFDAMFGEGSYAKLAGELYDTLRMDEVDPDLVVYVDAGERFVQVQTQTIDLGNNESMSRGVFPNDDGTFLAMTFTQSKTFKTQAGAERWLARKVGL